MVGPRVPIRSNMITYAHFLLVVFKFKLNFTNKSLINNVINQVIEQFCFESRPNNRL